MIQEIHDTISRVLERRALDARTCFTAVRAEPPGGGSIVVECSDQGVLEEVARELPGRVGEGEGDVTFVALPSPADALPEALVAAASVVDVRRAAAHTAELVTQLVWGDPVSPLKREGEWALVRLDDGYIGWVRSWHLEGRSRSEIDAYDRTARHRVRENVILIREAPEREARPVSDAVAGTPVLVEPCDRRGWRRVTLPDGRRGFAMTRDLERRHPRHGAPVGGEGALRPPREALAETALRFLGVPYVWGGTTPKGFDCSGLTQRVFNLNGIAIPRDSDMQARIGKSKPAGDIDALETGDLLFFGAAGARITHVAMSLSKGVFVHARGHVRINALFPTHHLFDAHLAGCWRSTCDPLSW